MCRRGLISHKLHEKQCRRTPTSETASLAKTELNVILVYTRKRTWSHKNSFLSATVFVISLVNAFCHRPHFITISLVPHFSLHAHFLTHSRPSSAIIFNYFHSFSSSTVTSADCRALHILQYASLPHNQFTLSTSLNRIFHNDEIDGLRERGSPSHLPIKQCNDGTKSSLA